MDMTVDMTPVKIRMAIIAEPATAVATSSLPPDLCVVLSPRISVPVRKTPLSWHSACPNMAGCLQAPGLHILGSRHSVSALPALLHACTHLATSNLHTSLTLAIIRTREAVPPLAGPRPSQESHLPEVSCPGRDAPGAGPPRWLITRLRKRRTRPRTPSAPDPP